MSSRFVIRVTTKRGAEIIANSFRRLNPVAAREYLDKYELQQRIEVEAKKLLEEGYRNSLN